MTLESEGRILLHFAAAYGFRNIQNLVQKLKRGRCPYHYVEVMACPSGIPSRPTLHGRYRGPFWDQCCGDVLKGRRGIRGALTPVTRIPFP